jgi:hypothetical protein
MVSSCYKLFQCALELFVILTRYNLFQDFKKLPFGQKIKNPVISLGSTEIINLRSKKFSHEAETDFKQNFHDADFINHVIEKHKSCQNFEICGRNSIKFT